MRIWGLRKARVGVASHVLVVYIGQAACGGWITSSSTEDSEMAPLGIFGIIDPVLETLKAMFPPLRRVKEKEQNSKKAAAHESNTMCDFMTSDYILLLITTICVVCMAVFDGI